MMILAGKPFSTKLSPVVMASTKPTLPTLQPVRFGEFLRDRALLTDEQWLAALAGHWSQPNYGARIGDTIVAAGFLSANVVEAEAKIFHDDLDVVEIAAAPAPLSERKTARFTARS